MNINKKQLIEDLKEHEGYNWLAPKSSRIGKSKFGAYLDHLGYKTTGIGHLIIRGDKTKYPDFNLDELTEEQAEIILSDDIDKHIKKLRRYFKQHNIDEEKLNSNQLRALINMTFQMGDLYIAGFKKMTKALSSRNFEIAVKEMKDSLWYKHQTPKRAQKVIDIFNTKVDLASEPKSTEMRQEEPKQQSILEVIIGLILKLINR